MATEIGWASLGIAPSFDGFERKLETGTAKAMLVAGNSGGTKFGDAAGRSAGSRFGSVFKSAAKASLLGIGALGAGAFTIGKDAIDQASSLNESLNAVNVTYGKQSKLVKKLGRDSAESLGLSQNEFNGISVQFSKFAKTVAGNDSRKAVGILDDLTTRGADFASVMDLEVNDALSLFQSGLAGETEPLRKYGIDLSAAAVEAFALSEGIAKGRGELTEAEKVQARYGLLMQGTNKAAGDFAETSDSLANRQRVLSARWDDAQAKLGRGLLPIVEDFTGFLLDEGVPAVEKFGDWFNEEGVDHLQRFGRFTKNEVLPILEDVGEFAQTAAGHAEDLVEFLNDLPKPAKYAGLVALLGGGVAAKLNSGGSGALGTAGKVLGIAKPVPVFVTNPGFGTGGVPGTGGGRPPAVVPPWLRDIPKAATKFGFIRGLSTLGAGTQQDVYMPEPLNFDKFLKAEEEKRDAVRDLFLRPLGVDVPTHIEEFLIGPLDKATGKARELQGDLEKVSRPRQLQLALIGVEEVQRQLHATLGIFETRSHIAESRAADATAPAPRTSSTAQRGVSVNVGTLNVNSKEAVESWALNKGQQAAMGGWG